MDQELQHRLRVMQVRGGPFAKQSVFGGRDPELLGRGTQSVFVDRGADLFGRGPPKKRGADFSSFNFDELWQTIDDHLKSDENVGEISTPSAPMQSAHLSERPKEIVAESVLPNVKPFPDSKVFPDIKIFPQNSAIPSSNDPHVKKVRTALTRANVIGTTEPDDNEITKRYHAAKDRWHQALVKWGLTPAPKPAEEQKTPTPSRDPRAEFEAVIADAGLHGSKIVDADDGDGGSVSGSSVDGDEGDATDDDRGHFSLVQEAKAKYDELSLEEKLEEWGKQRGTAAKSLKRETDRHNVLKRATGTKRVVAKNWKGMVDWQDIEDWKDVEGGYFNANNAKITIDAAALPALQKLWVEDFVPNELAYRNMNMRQYKREVDAYDREIDSLKAERDKPTDSRRPSIAGTPAQSDNEEFIDVDTRMAEEKEFGDLDPSEAPRRARVERVDAVHAIGDVTGVADWVAHVNDTAQMFKTPDGIGAYLKGVNAAISAFTAKNPQMVERMSELTADLGMHFIRVWKNYADEQINAVKSSNNKKSVGDELDMALIRYKNLLPEKQVTHLNDELRKWREEQQTVLLRELEFRSRKRNSVKNVTLFIDEITNYRSMGNLGKVPTDVYASTMKRLNARVEQMTVAENARAVKTEQTVKHNAKIKADDDRTTPLSIDLHTNATTQKIKVSTWLAAAETDARKRLVDSDDVATYIKRLSAALENSPGKRKMLDAESVDATNKMRELETNLTRYFDILGDSAQWRDDVISYLDAEAEINNSSGINMTKGTYVLVDRTGIMSVANEAGMKKILKQYSATNKGYDIKIPKFPKLPKGKTRAEKFGRISGDPASGQAVLYRWDKAVQPLNEHLRAFADRETGNVIADDWNAYVAENVGKYADADKTTPKLVIAKLLVGKQDPSRKIKNVDEDAAIAARLQQLGVQLNDEDALLARWNAFRT